MILPSPVADEYERIAALYDLVPAYRDRGDVGFYLQAAKRASGEVLEVGCGTGRVLIPLAREGQRMTGVDVSASMLRVCRDRLADEPAVVRERTALVQADMRTFDVGRQFALIITPFRAFQHLLTVEDQLAALASMRRHLADDGMLILDVFNPSLDALANRPIGEEFEDTPPCVLADGRRFERRGRIVLHDRIRQVNDIELIYIITALDGRTERVVHAFSMRYLFRYEAEHLLARAGFGVQHVFGGYDGEPFGSTYPGELILVAKPG